MARNGSVSRRRLLKIAGAASATALVAGCTGNGDDDDAPADDGNGDDDDGEEIDESAWEGVDTIELNAYTAGWEGVSPSVIDGETNPTIVLFEGEEYDFTWYNQDGAGHNIEIWDEDEEVVDDYATDIVTDDEQTLEGVVASEEMAYYRCDPHAGMQGRIEIR
ncbi:plastocyanin/azurin family copper-binding protein [Natronobeatus ordinarius]|uniref:plastocyanin/azurin family copper-binding protein n=1 Tax=Natronobeatus ordinarius TaxID=2963433 RepID=UPI0020CE898B|nr:plastocyanin/azurin family copper-binding protein [Natronobeatus ordinarius]